MAESYLIIGQQFWPSDNEICIVALLYQERFSDKVGNIVGSDETDLAILRCTDDFVVHIDTFEVNG